MNTRVILRITAVALLASTVAYAQEQSDWLKARQAEFAAWTAAHPNPEGRIADLKAKTKAMVTAYVNLPAIAHPAAGLPPTILRVPDAPKELWDGPDTPQMVVIPAGAYTMGSPETEQNHQTNETQHRVTIGYSFAVGKFDVTLAEYTAFVSATGYNAKDDEGCYVRSGTVWNLSSGASWQRPGFDQTANDPVVCVSWDDAQAYIAWLSQKTGHAYRLLSESEYEYAARAGTTTAYWWGDSVGTNMANCDGCGSKWDNKRTSPSGSFQANSFGLYDMNGNVWQWMADCMHDDYNGAPKDGSAWDGSNCGVRVRRGGSWYAFARYARAAYRFKLDHSASRVSIHGFRVARTF